MKSSLSSFELRHVVAELQVLIGAKIEKIFQQEKPKDDFLFSLHIPNKGKKYLYFSLPRAFCLNSFKPLFPDMPPSFCSSLRRKITNAKITGISQQGFQRIVVINLSSKNGPSSLIIELFSSGNMLLIDEKNTILSVLHQKIWNEKRKLLHGKTYQFPEEQFDPSLMSKDNFKALLISSTKDSLVTFLAIDCSLGGTYAEYVLNQANLDKAQPLKGFKSFHELFITIQDLFSLKTNAISTRDEAFPIFLKDGESHSSFNEAIATLLLKDLEAAEKKELNKDKSASLSKFDKIIASQTHQRDGLVVAAKQNQEAGELIYSNYQEVKAVLETIKLLRKTLSWSEIKGKMKTNSLIKSIDEHTGKIQVDLL